MYKITIKTKLETLSYEIEDLDSPKLFKIMETPDIIEFKMEYYDNLKLIRKKNVNERRS